jgi:protein TonB
MGMFELKNVVPKTVRLLPAAPPAGNTEERKQRRMMAVALVLLLVALGVVLYRDSDFWFPETEQAEEQPQPEPTATAPPVVKTATPSIVAQPVSTPNNNKKVAKSQPKAAAPAQTVAAGPSAPPITVNRTVLPALEVEVIAGDVHQTIHPGTNSVRVDLQPGSAAHEVVVPPATGSANAHAARVTSNAAERVQMSADTVEVVSRPVKPDYPLLARQMKVEGSVILQALIGRDGLIQNLHVISGPPILASAAQEAVKQWHFKPHYQGADPVETQARITVNFTISTN